MIQKSTLQKRLAQLRRIKTWQLVVILILGLFLSATLLRLNNLGMIERRDAVASADEKGDEAAIRTTLLDLQRYVSSHMNTSLGGGIYLTASYNRDYDAAIASASDSANPNALVYQQASVECRARWQGGVESFRNDYVACVVERVKALAPAEDAVTSLRLPQAESYHYDFVSPLISFDPAGLSVLFCLILLLGIIGRITSVIIVRLLLRRRFQPLS